MGEASDTTQNKVGGRARDDAANNPEIPDATCTTDATTEKQGNGDNGLTRAGTERRQIRIPELTNEGKEALTLPQLTVTRATAGTRRSSASLGRRTRHHREDQIRREHRRRKKKQTEDHPNSSTTQRGWGTQRGATTGENRAWIHSGTTPDCDADRNGRRDQIWDERDADGRRRPPAAAEQQGGGDGGPGRPDRRRRRSTPGRTLARDKPKTAQQHSGRHKETADVVSGLLHIWKTPR